MVSVFVNQYKDPFSGNAPLDSVSFWGIRPSYFSKFFPVLSILESSGKVISSWKLRKSEVAQSCPTLCDPMDCSPPGSSVHGILQARILEWVAISFSRGSSRPRDRTQVPALQADALTSEPPGKPYPWRGRRFGSMGVGPSSQSLITYLKSLKQMLREGLSRHQLHLLLISPGSATSSSVEGFLCTILWLVDSEVRG